MRYTVLWDTDVETAFINAWTAADSPMRAILTHIANWVDQNLAEDPDKLGQFRDDLNAYILAVPLSDSAARVAITYQVLADDRQVRVVRLLFSGA